MKKIVILFTFGSLFYSCHKLIEFPPAHGHSSIEFNKVFGGSEPDVVSSVLITNDDGYFLTANSQSSDGDVSSNKGDYDAWAVKLNKSGDVEWQKSFGGSDFELMASSAKNNAGGYIMAGLTTSNDGDVSGAHGFYDGWIVNLNHTGKIVWQKAIGGSMFEDFQKVITSYDHGYVVVGATNSNDGDVSGLHGADDDGWILELDNSGNIIWQKTLGGTGSERFHEIIKTFDGGYLVVGHATSTDGDVHSNDGGVDGWVVKLDRHGNIEWEKTYGGSEQEIFTGLTPALDGGYILIGTTTSTDGDVTNYHGGQDFWAVKIDYKGDLQWQKTLGGSDFEAAADIVATPLGEYIITGVTTSNDGDVTAHHGPGFGDGWVIKIDGHGNKMWQKTYGGSDVDVFNTIAARWNGSFVTAGWASSNDGDISRIHGKSDAWVVSVSP